MLSDIKKSLNLLLQTDSIEFRHLVFVVILAFMSSVLEILSILSIFSIIDFILLGSSATGIFNIIVNEDNIKYFGSVFVMTIILNFVCRVYGLKVQTLFVLKSGALLQASIVRAALEHPYNDFLKSGPSFFVSSAIQKCSFFVENALFPIINLSVSIFLMVSIFIVSYVISPMSASVIFVLPIIAYGIIGLIIAPHLRSASKDVGVYIENIQKLVSQAFNNFRTVRIYNLSNKMVKDTKTVAFLNAELQAKLVVYAVSPRFFIEAFLYLIVIGLAFFSSSEASGLSGNIPELGAILFGVQRMFPYAQSAYASWAKVRGCGVVSDELIEICNANSMELETEGNSFGLGPIELKDISVVVRDYEVQNSSERITLLQDFSVNFPSNRLSVITGRSGVGKSTLLDVMIGFVQPQHGTVQVNGRKIKPGTLKDWWREIALVSQSVEIFPGSLLDNLCLEPDFKLDTQGTDEIVRLLSDLGLDDFLKQISYDLNRNISESGLDLSGGQRQRIGLARAVFSGRKYIFLDEALNALDNFNNEKVFKFLLDLCHNKNRTVIMISHSQYHTKNADFFIELT